MTFKIGCIVEGDGEVKALPVLIRRIAWELYPEITVIVEAPIRAPRYLVIKEGQLESRIELAVQKIGGRGAIFIVLDSEGNCPAHLGPELLQRASQTRNDIPIAVVIAKNEFEGWFLAAAESLRGIRGLKSDIAFQITRKESVMQRDGLVSEWKTTEHTLKHETKLL